MKRRVALNFSGSVVVDIDVADPDDDEEWAEAVGKAWAAVTDNDISTSATFDSEEIIDDARGATCDDSPATLASVPRTADHVCRSKPGSFGTCERCGAQIDS